MLLVQDYTLRYTPTIMEKESEHMGEYSKEEMRQAQENVDAYLTVVHRIYELISSDPTSALLLNQLLKHMESK